MYQLNFDVPSKLHFTGIGGISMSALAQIMLAKGFTVTGSDTQKTNLTEHLESLGATIYYKQEATNIAPDIDALIYTAAVKDDNPELVSASNMDIPLLTRAEFLGQVMKNYKTSIGVSGTHGKTTVTSMISQILLEADTDPTILVGGILPSISGNIRVGHSEHIITESCEYTNSFLSFPPKIGIILNIAADHLDFFKDLNDIRNSFKRYASLIPDDGALIICSDIENYEYITEGLHCKIITYGLDSKKSMYSATKVTYDQYARGRFDLMIGGNVTSHVRLSVTGEHNISNALAAIATSQTLGIDEKIILKGLQNYTGTERRFQYKGVFSNVTVIDDYAHHPDEIRATITTAKHYPHRRMWVVFQPHTYTRTKALLDDFALELSKADIVVLADIYAAREQNTYNISSKDLMKKIQKQGCEVYYFPSFYEIEKFLLENCLPNDLLITMGAGDVVKIGEDLLTK